MMRQPLKRNGRKSGKKQAVLPPVSITANQNIIGKIRSYNSSNEWISCSTKSGGFNIRKGSTPNLFLITCKCPCCEKQLWAIEAYDRNQKLLFVITTGSERYESSFRKEVNMALKDFDLM